MLSWVSKRHQIKIKTKNVLISRVIVSTNDPDWTGNVLTVYHSPTLPTLIDLSKMPSKSDVRIQAMPKGPGEGICDSCVRRYYFNEFSKDPINRTEKKMSLKRKKIKSIFVHFVF